jgi:hypothetical protein
MACIDEIVTLSDAADRPGLSVHAIRKQVREGPLPVNLLGSTYVTTVDEVERYRCERLGRRGRRAIIDSGAARTWVRLGTVSGRPGGAWGYSI